MTANDEATVITRRAALKRAAAVLGGSMTASQLGLLTRAFAAMDEEAEPRFLGRDRLRMLERIVDVIIPVTDTPGAAGAGVHRFIDLMLAEWASPARQSRYLAGLEDIDERARSRGAGGFAGSPVALQTDILRQLDDEAFADGSPGTFFRELKRMTLFAYYSSQPGASEELRYERIPGDYDPCLSMEEDDRAWFWNGYSYDL